jgi:pimeloyl-ACP methyl ester carboxylesterase
MPRSLLRRAFQTLVGREDIHNRLGEIKAPSLVIHGTADAAIDVELAQRLCSELADCRGLVLVEGAGHASNLTHPDEVNTALKQFLGDLALIGTSS